MAVRQCEQLMESARKLLDDLEDFLKENELEIKHLREENISLKQKNADIAGLFETAAEILKRG